MDSVGDLLYQNEKLVPDGFYGGSNTQDYIRARIVAKVESVVLGFRDVSQRDAEHLR